jgi:CRP-like cAMP-binding protein
MFKSIFSADHTLDAIIKNCPLFKGLSSSELKTIMKTAHVREYSSEERIFSEGTLGLCFYIIAKGSVDIVSENPEGKPKVLRKYDEGAYFSEVHLFTETNHTVSCVAREVTKMIIFSKPDIEDLIKVKPRIGNKMLLNFLEYLSQQLDNLYKENKELLKKIPDGAAY